MGDAYSRIWKAKIPYKIKIFLWLLEQGATLTKDNMLKRKWVGDPTCRFCDNVETLDHLFFQCSTVKIIWGCVAACFGTNRIPGNLCQFWKWIKESLPGGEYVHCFGLAAIAWATWKARNKACFEHKLIKHPVEILFHACSLMKFWAGLFKIEVQEQIAEGVQLLLTMAHTILNSQQRSPPTPPRLLPVIEEEGDQDDDDHA